MNNDFAPKPVPPPKQIGKFKFLLLALCPIPVGLLFFTFSKFLAAWNITIPGVVVTFLCCLVGSIGICGGFDQRDRPFALFGGVMLGLVLFLVEILAILYLGCAITMNQH